MWPAGRHSRSSRDPEKDAAKYGPTLQAMVNSLQVSEHQH